MPVKNRQAESGIFLKSLFDTFVSPGRVRTNVKIIAPGCSSCIMSATNALDTRRNELAYSNEPQAVRSRVSPTEEHPAA